MLRTAALAAVALLAAALLGAWSAELGARGVVRVDDAVALGTAAGGALVAAWYALSATALVLARLVELSTRAPRLARGLRAVVTVAGAPVLRRAAAVGVGAGLALAAVPAVAGPATDDTVPHDLRPGIGALSDPGPEPEAPAPEPPAGLPEEPGPETSASAAPRTVAAVTDGSQPAGGAADRPSGGPAAHAPGAAAHVVRPGDSLWSIARSHLGEGASDADVAAEWPRWHETNRAVVGANPHLIHPGQHLLAPETEEQR
ncbi:LysM peptidoglycan-binding domain-containing protein [Georgenia satyanarayanai]|uniref:LysM peptidoglycan-binding domain-containing protein n=1 Tax=Georgenia satyanarayanai TaxID=860221 RepID=UPI0012642A23|nr:LysM domain-containing protein [Georgenia satyanarayanai]